MTGARGAARDVFCENTSRAAESGESAPDPVNLTQFALPEGSCSRTRFPRRLWLFLRPASQPARHSCHLRSARKTPPCAACSTGIWPPWPRRRAWPPKPSPAPWKRAAWCFWATRPMRDSGPSWWASPPGSRSTPTSARRRSATARKPKTAKSRPPWTPGPTRSWTCPSPETWTPSARACSRPAPCPWARCPCMPWASRFWTPSATSAA